MSLEKYESGKFSNAELDASSIVLEDLTSFQIALENLRQRGVSYPQLLDTLQHENAHANVAEQLGGKHHGYRIIFFENGELEEEGRYHNGKLCGECKTYNEKGKCVRCFTYSENSDDSHEHEEGCCLKEEYFD